VILHFANHAYPATCSACREPAWGNAGVRPHTALILAQDGKAERRRELEDAWKVPSVAPTRAV
jgi:hypothetical protein